MAGIHTPVRLALTAGILSILSLAPAFPAAAAAPPSAARTDPAIGPHARDEMRHQHDVVPFAPMKVAIAPRRSAPLSAAAAPSPASLIQNGGALRREVLGFAPYWELSQNTNWNYSMLSTVAYFGLDVQADGNFDQSTSGWAHWNTDGNLPTIITAAHQAGDRVDVVIKQFNTQTICQIVYTSAANAIYNTIAAIKSKQLDGVNVDFEGQNGTCPNGQSVQAGVTSFMAQLTMQVHAQVPGGTVTIDTYSGSASWNDGIFKIDDLAPRVDALFVMAYDMNFSDTPDHAGATAPLNGGTYNDTLAVQQYLAKAPASKIILGVPYYGYKWCTVDASANSAAAYGAAGQCPHDATKNPEADTYAQAAGDFQCVGPVNQLAQHWDDTAQSPWASWFSPAASDPCGGNHNSSRELYYDNAQSLGLKYDLVNTNGLLGTGMWALGFDGSAKDLWNEIATKFAGPSTTFYFSEGFTGNGFRESLSLLMPGYTGVAYIDYYTESGHLPTFGINVHAGQVTVVDVNQYVGPSHQVSAVVTLPAPGVAERVMHFNTGTWHGSTAKVGVARPQTEWDFAEGSTLPYFSEYVSLQNPSATPAPVTLNYFTDGGAHPTKTLTVPANSRTTVEVFHGDTTSPNAACLPSGPGANCGVGAWVGGVSLQVRSATVPIVAERPMYVNNFSFGDGVIRDGHDAFGVNAAGTAWNFAEGTTLAGFREYLTLQNPGTIAADVTLKYVDTAGVVTNKAVAVPPMTRVTVEVFNPQYGVGPGVGGVSAQVSSNQPIVAERPIYMVHNFGSGVVAGAHVVTGATATASTYEFSNASTVSGENDYLTIENMNGTAANLSISYYGSSGRVSRSVTVAPNSRHTVEVFNALEGIGRSYAPLGIVVVADQPVLVEEPTYNALSASYGATNTAGYTPSGS